MKQKKKLSIRQYFFIILLSLAVIPILFTVIISVIFKPPATSYEINDSEMGDVHSFVRDHVFAWQDKEWQAQFQEKLQNANLRGMLLDENDQIIFVMNTISSNGPIIINLPETNHSEKLTGNEIHSQNAVADANLPYYQMLNKIKSVYPFQHSFYENGKLIGQAFYIPEFVSRSDSYHWLEWSRPFILLFLFLSVLLISFSYIGKAILQPLTQFAYGARRISSGEWNDPLPQSQVREISVLSDAFSKMKNELKESMARQRKMEEERKFFISSIIHDLRTPIFSIRGHLEGLQKGIAHSPEKQEKYLKVCQDKAQHLEDLVSDLFIYTQLDVLNKEPFKKEIAINDFIHHLMDGFLPLAQEKKVRLKINDHSVKSRILGDLDLLNRAFANLIDNAIKYTPLQGVVEVTYEEVTLQGKTYVKLMVEDSGPGLSAADIPDLFNPLFRGEESRNSKTGGIGLGLTIAERIVHAHGGTIAATNKDNGGARFTVTLPVYS